ncbi:DUF6300 family protein [Streptomyces violarus]|uniref:DUF6300 family protein n=1 Tax=Streptomyces violarus TaxID=67380 RepID=UPI0037040CA9
MLPLRRRPPAAGGTAQGTGVWMELCPACDADRPAACAFIAWPRVTLTATPRRCPSCSRHGRPRSCMSTAGPRGAVRALQSARRPRLA